MPRSLSLGPGYGFLCALEVFGHLQLAERGLALDEVGPGLAGVAEGEVGFG